MKLRTKIAAVAAAAALTLGGGVAYSAIPHSQTGEITACVANYTGVVKIIDKEAGKDCGFGYVETTWNQRGPQGLPGPKGDQGLQGPAGEAAGPIFLHVVTGSAAYGTPTATQWAECPAGSVLASAAGSQNGWYMLPSSWNVPPSPTTGTLSFGEYSDTGARFSFGFPDQGPDYPTPPSDATYRITLKCQGM